MPSNELVGSQLRTLATSKPAANILELGTGIGLSLLWIAGGMSKVNQRIEWYNNERTYTRKHFYGSKTPLQTLKDSDFLLLACLCK